MSVYAFLKNGIIDNVVEVDDGAVEALGLLFPDVDEFIESTDETGRPSVGGSIVNGKFRVASPYASWVWDEAKNNWMPPIAIPDATKPYSWDEPTTSWVELPAPVLAAPTE